MFVKSAVCLATVGGLAVGISPGMAADKGLYGSGDPTYDGSYRQSLSVLALTATGRKVPADAVRWLKNQQCKSGGFVEYRSAPDAQCPRPDPANLVGPDLNATAVAIPALVATGNRAQARRAAVWIKSKRNDDGGWSYVPGPGATSDSASTALALSSMALVGVKAKSSYLRAVQRRCEAPVSQRGGLAFDTSLPSPNNGASGQASWVLGGGLELPSPTKIAKSSPSLKCSGKQKNKASIEDALLGFVSKRLVAKDGALPYGGGYPGIDYGGTASAALGLAQAGAGRKAVQLTTKYLSKHADEWISADGSDNPGAIALLILLADATKEDPRDFGGIDLIRRLDKTRQR